MKIMIFSNLLVKKEMLRPKMDGKFKNNKLLENLRYAI
jgi:hypothetical protein